jgi:CPA2 family monovalent cation:H+ antiporter-2
VVVVGHGRVGSKVVAQLKEQGISCVVAEQDRAIVEDLRKNGIPAVSGDASDPFVLIQAHIANAAVLVIATQDSIDISKMVETAKTLNPKIAIFIRARNNEEIEIYNKEGWGQSFTPEDELANRFCRGVLKELKQANKA